MKCYVVGTTTVWGKGADMNVRQGTEDVYLQGDLQAYADYYEQCIEQRDHLTSKVSNTFADNLSGQTEPHWVRRKQNATQYDMTDAANLVANVNKYFPGRTLVRIEPVK